MVATAFYGRVVLLVDGVEGGPGSLVYFDELHGLLAVAVVDVGC